MFTLKKKRSYYVIYLFNIEYPRKLHVEKVDEFCNKNELREYLADSCPEILPLRIIRA